jgi:predicted GNAT family acetyltransferase
MAIDSGAIRNEGRPGGGRYVYDFPDGTRSVLTYFEAPVGIVTIDHTETPPKHRGQGFAGALVARAVEDFRAAGKKVVPACPFAYGEFRRHPEWSDLLLREAESRLA